MFFFAFLAFLASSSCDVVAGIVGSGGGGGLGARALLAAPLVPLFEGFGFRFPCGLSISVVEVAAAFTETGWLRVSTWGASNPSD